MYCSMSSKLSNFLLRNQPFYIYMTWFTFLSSYNFQFFSLFYILKCLNYNMQSDMLFWSCIFGILYASCTCLGYISTVWVNFLLWYRWRSGLCIDLGYFSLFYFYYLKVGSFHGVLHFLYVLFLCLDFFLYSLLISSRSSPFLESWYFILQMIHSTYKAYLWLFYLDHWFFNSIFV